MGLIRGLFGVVISPEKAARKRTKTARGAAAVVEATTKADRSEGGIFFDLTPLGDEERTMWDNRKGRGAGASSRRAAAARGARGRGWWGGRGRRGCDWEGHWRNRAHAENRSQYQGNLGRVRSRMDARDLAERAPRRSQN